MDQRTTWRLVGVACGLAAGALTRAVLTGIWRRVEREDPPDTPGVAGTSWAPALVWAISSGATLAVVRLVAQRGAAEAWKSATGAYPEGIDPAD